MARATKRTSVLLGSLAAIFIIIIVILCIVPKTGPGHDQPKSGEVKDVLTDTSTAPTTTTSTTTTTAPPPPPLTTTETTTATPPTTTPAPPPPPPTETTTATPPTTTPAPPPPPPPTATTSKSTTMEATTETSPTTAPPPPPTTTATTTTTPPHTNTTTDTDYEYHDSYEDDDTTNTTTLSPTDDQTTTTITQTTMISTTTPLSTTQQTTSTPPPPPTTTTTTATTTLSPTDDFTTDDSTNTTTLSPTDDFTTDDSTNTTTLLPTDDDDQSATNTTTQQTTSPPPSTTSPPPPPPPSPTQYTTTATTTATTATTTTSPKEVKKHCETPACKTLASNMLASMDHSGNVDRCEDFYQYACGGLMQNPFLHPRNPKVIALNRIKEELETTDADESTSLGKMRIFYDSCLDAVDQDTTQGWLRAMKEVFGPDCFDWTAKSALPPIDLTHVLAKLMLHDFTPFFDVDLDVNPEENDAFSVTLSPALPGSPFSDDLARRTCLEDHHRRLDELGADFSVDINEEYSMNFIECVLRGKGLDARMDRMEEAVRTFGLLDHLLNSATAKTDLQDTITQTRRLLEELSHVAPNVVDLKRRLRTKDHIKQMIPDLDHKYINWTALVDQLITVRDISLVSVASYMYDGLSPVLSVLQRHNNDSSTALGRVLMMLWSERLYTDFVKPLGSGVGETDYCLQASVTLLPNAASKLYMNTLTDDERKTRNQQIDNITVSISRAGERELQRASKTGGEVQEKLEDMLKNVELTEWREVKNSTDKLNITRTDNFFDNCIRFLDNKRRLRYDMYNKDPGEVPWKFMQPYEASGVHVYTLNKIMVPFAAQDDSSTFGAIPAYLSYAGLGHMISHLVMHAYDTAGVSFQAGGTKDLLDEYQYFTEMNEGMKEQYMANTSYDVPGSDGVKATVQMSRLALNELLADSGATRLAWEAYTMRNYQTSIPKTTMMAYIHSSARRRRSLQDLLSRTRRAAPGSLPSIESDEETLPWLGLSPIQLYFLHWSQGHCSASGGMNMLELMEGEQPPAKMRVNLVLRNEELFSKAFNCTPMSEQKPFVLG